jgi:hypothetical protein
MSRRVVRLRLCRLFYTLYADLFFDAASLDRSHHHLYTRHTFAMHSLLLARMLMVIRVGL